MFEKKSIKMNDLPIKEKERHCTDVLCTIFGALYSLVLFILSFAFLRYENYLKVNFPTDSDHDPCSFGVNKQFSFLYFPNINDINARVCVSQCPKKSDLQILCKTNSQVPTCVAINIYQTYENQQRLGGICTPEDQSETRILMQNLGLLQKISFNNYYDIFHISLIIMILLAFFWMILIQGLPYAMAFISTIFGSLFLMVIGIIVIVDDVGGWSEPLKYLLGVILMFLGIFLIIVIILYFKHLKMVGILLRCAGQFINARYVNFFYIPISIFLTLCFVVLCIFEYLAFTSHSDPQPKDNDIFLHLKANPTLTILTMIQFVWGFQFLKDSFNFVISGNAAEWYINEERNNCCLPFSRLMKHNFGSVVAGSFLNGFFNFINFIFQLLRCYPDGKCIACAPCCEWISKYSGCFFDLVRTDTYAFINLLGSSYCNSARNCQTLCRKSQLFVGTQSVMFLYRLCSHVFCIGVVLLLSYYLMKVRNGQINLLTLGLIVFFTYCVQTYFIDLHANAAEGILISYLLERQLGDIFNFEFQTAKNQLRLMENKL